MDDIIKFIPKEEGGDITSRYTVSDDDLVSTQEGPAAKEEIISRLKIKKRDFNLYYVKNDDDNNTLFCLSFLNQKLLPDLCF